MKKKVLQVNSDLGHMIPCECIYISFIDKANISQLWLGICQVILDTHFKGMSDILPQKDLSMDLISGRSKTS